MEKFSLEKWLQDKSRKVVTRDGREVRIICWDAKDSKPIVALVLTRSISRRGFDELTINYFNDGTYYGGGVNEDSLDLFFADEDESEDERIRKALIQGLSELRTCFPTCPTFGGVEVEDILDWLDKKSEQKPADKVEPKFHEGDWIISDTVNKDYQICKIIGIKDGNYTIESIYGYKGYNQFEEFDNVYRLWTIQDAKDGNVLVNGSNIFIFSNLSSTRVMGYCHINLDDGRFYDDKGKNECFGLIDAVFTPTTKEQYFLLFQKMKEAGYEWDAEKKELKKIEANSIWSEDDEAFLYEAIYAVKNFFKGCAQDELVHWLKSLYESKGKNNRSLYESKGKNNRTDYRC